VIITAVIEEKEVLFVLIICFLFAKFYAWCKRKKEK